MPQIPLLKLEILVSPLLLLVWWRDQGLEQTFLRYQYWACHCSVKTDCWLVVELMLTGCSSMTPSQPFLHRQQSGNKYMIKNILIYLPTNVTLNMPFTINRTSRQCNWHEPIIAPITIHFMVVWYHIFDFSYRSNCARISLLNMSTKWDYKGKDLPYILVTERWTRSWSRCTGSQPAVTIKSSPGGRLQLLSTRPAFTFVSVHQMAPPLNEVTDIQLQLLTYRPEGSSLHYAKAAVLSLYLHTKIVLLTFHTN